MKKCYICGAKFKDNDGVHRHITIKHKDQIPKDYSVEQFYYVQRTGKTEGKCVECKRPTGWNDSTNKYHRFCTDPKCKKDYRKRFEKNMIGARGKVTLLNDPEHQRKMLANRSISGKYKWSDGVDVPYTGSYEKDFLGFLDTFMGFSSRDIMAPSPHTYYYEYQGEKKFYIPDFFIPSLNLEIEVKDGGNNPNMHGKIQSVDKVKERKKDKVLMSQRAFSYIKITNKEYALFLEILYAMKESYRKDGEPAIFFYGEEADSTNIRRHKQPVNENSILMESVSDDEEEDVTVEESQEIIRSAINDDTEEALEYSLTFVQNLPRYEGTEVLEDYINSRITYHKMLESNDSVTMLSVNERNILSEFMENMEVDNLRDEVMDNHDLDYEGMLENLLMYGPTVEKQNTVPYTKAVMLLENVRTQRIKTRTGVKYPVFVLLTHTGTTLSRIIKNVSKRPFSHSSISFDSSLETLYSFGRDRDSGFFEGTFIEESINEGVLNDRKENINYGLYVTLVSDDDIDRMIERLNYFIKRKKRLKYNMVGLIQHALGLESSRGDKYFCSQFVDMVLQASDTHFGKHSSLVHPSDYMNHQNFHLVSEGLLKDYDSKVVDKRVRNLAYKSLANPTEETKRYTAIFIPVEDGMLNKRVKIEKGMKLPVTYSSFVKHYPGKRYFFAPLELFKDISSYSFDIHESMIRFSEEKSLKITNINQ